MTQHRDADSTRQRLLEAARLRFARDGFGSTTVRDIASDAGVNVALINRYFTSKVGLFEACLRRTARELGDAERSSTSFDQMIATMVDQVASSPTEAHSLQLLMLLRTSGDEEADRIRRRTLDDFTRGMAGIAGWRADDPTTGHLLLRAQIAIATTMGIAILRSSTGVEPLTSATAADLSGPLDDAVRALLG
jgi:AcrR family transcriptional regulator